MKKIGIIVLMLLMLGCEVLMNDDNTATPEELLKKGNSLPPDINLDEYINEEGNFDFSTIHVLPFSVTLKDENELPVTGALITVMDSENTEITRAVSDIQGKAVFTAVAAAVSSTLTLRIEHLEYTDKEVLITDVSSLASINRQIYTASLAAVSPATPKPPQDSDGDGIPDYLDQFPYDADVVSQASSEYTLAFEDTYPAKGDADFNDVVVSLRFLELYNSANNIVKIQIYTRLQAAGAGYLYNKFLINIADTEYTLIENTRDAISANYNCRQDDIYLEAVEEELIIVFDPPLSRSDIEPFPYDPFVRIENQPDREAHLPFVETPFPGHVLDTDGFPWGIVIPRNWYWPYENGDIREAYPEFEPWYTSGGDISGNWYSFPEADLVYKKDEHRE